MVLVQCNRRLAGLVLLCLVWLLLHPATLGAQEEQTARDTAELKWEIGVNGFYFFNKFRYHPLFVKRFYGEGLQKGLRFSANLALNYYQGGVYDDERYKLGPAHKVGFRIGHEWRDRRTALYFYRGGDLSYDFFTDDIGISLDIVPVGATYKIEAWDYVGQKNHAIGLIAFTGAGYALTDRFSITMEKQLSASVNFYRYKTGISNLLTGEDTVVADERNVTLITEFRPIYLLSISYQF